MRDQIKRLNGIPVTEASYMASRAGLWEKILMDRDERDQMTERDYRLLATDLRRCADELRKSVPGPKEDS